MLDHYKSDQYYECNFFTQIAKLHGILPTGFARSYKVCFLLFAIMICHTNLKAFPRVPKPNSSKYEKKK